MPILSLSPNKPAAESRLHQLASFLSEVTLPTVIQAIEQDHDDLKVYIKVLKDPAASHAEKRHAFAPFVDLLRSHSLAEERAVYEACQNIPALELRAEEGIVEHSIARRLVEKVSHLRHPARWEAHVKVLAEFVERHIEEEEREFLPRLWAEVTAEVRDQMRAAFLSERRQARAGGVLAA